MWFLDCEISDIEARGLPPKVEKALVDIKENGVAVMPGNTGREECDAIVRDFNNHIANSDEAFKYRVISEAASAFASTKVQRKFCRRHSPDLRL